MGVTINIPFVTNSNTLRKLQKSLTHCFNLCFSALAWRPFYKHTGEITPCVMKKSGVKVVFLSCFTKKSIKLTEFTYHAKYKCTACVNHCIWRALHSFWPCSNGKQLFWVGVGLKYNEVYDFELILQGFIQ